ncbi:MAG TPA: DUF2249 domain-containing protein [Gemmatimonadaceae bacterium]|nr:DUF2249 domain-containing protein [Gemmatimonadaceae bacterium]
MSRIYAVTPNGEYIAFPDEAPVVELDVRADLRAGRNPLSKIMAAADALARTEVLHLRATLAPVPLIGMLSERGLVYHMESHDDEDWSVWFWRPS